jgi:hypothetical protein
MKAGDVCVQRGTIHGWTNYSDKPARVYFVLTGKASSTPKHEGGELSANMFDLAAAPVKIGGQLLRDEGFKKELVESGGEKVQSRK